MKINLVSEEPGALHTVSVCVRNYTVRILNMAIILSIAVLGLQLIVGYTGQFSFGHAAFYGIGA